MKRYRLQTRPFIEHKQRGWGFGRVASYGPWRTLKAFDTLELARTVGRRASIVGLAQWRILYGQEKHEL